MEHRITALKVQENHPERINVFLDGEFAFGLSRIVAAWLNVSQTLSDEKIASLLTEDERDKSYQRALKLLSRRERSEAEIRKNLERHHIPEETIDYVLTRLHEKGLSDDLRYAQNWVENRNTFRPRSKKALAFELRLRGIDDEAIQQVTQDLDEEELAYQAGVKQSSKYHDLDWPAFRQKLTGFLARRGFHYGIITPVIRRIWTENQSGDFSNGESR